LAAAKIKIKVAIGNIFSNGGNKKRRPSQVKSLVCKDKYLES
jgi:hypothetical protein